MENDQSNEPEQNENEEEEENKLMYIYEWVDSIPLSRQKKNIARDFNDAVLLAEMIKYHYPRLVDLHNYPSACSSKQKLSNWNTLNTKVLKKLGLRISKEEINDVMSSKPGAIENLLAKVYRVIHGLPQETKKQNNEMSNNNVSNDNANIGRENRGITDEETHLQEMIIQKDQEIMNLKDHIENLEKQINESNNNQSYLENRLRELNEIIRKNEIEF